MAGSGEPLLYLDLIIKIAGYCKKISDDFGKDVIPMLATNGMLLNEKIASKLQKAGILFGISIDGYKELHNKNRVSINNKETFDIILNNYLEIEHKDYIGVAMTICEEDTDVYNAYINLMQYFNTVSLRFARKDYDKFDFSYIIDGYIKFGNYLIDEAIENENITPLIKILNGDDYFGRDIIKIISNSYLDTRCDAGVSRFSLGTDKKEYPCPSCSYEENIENLFNGNKICASCELEHFCGGICPIQKNKYKGIENVCQMKWFFFEISLYVVGSISLLNNKLYEKLVIEVENILRRQNVNLELKEKYKKLKGQYKYTELKTLFDLNYEEFKRL